MRNFFPALFVLFFLLQACAAPAAPTATRAPSSTPTSADTPTPTQTLTVTPSPTIVKIPTIDWNATPTPPSFVFDFPTPIGGFGGALLPTITPSSPGEGFESVEVSPTNIYWGICRSNKITFTVEVSEPDDVYSVVLFIRLRHLKAEIFTDWNKGIALEPLGDTGIWSQTFSANSIEGHEKFRRGWVWYQLVATGAYGIELGRTHIYADTIKLEPCMCLTPPCGYGD